MKKYIKYLFLIGLLVSPLSVHALTGSANLSCDKAKLSSGESTTCTLTGTASNGSVSNLSGQISVSNNLELVSVATSNIWQGSGDGGNIQLYTDVDKTGNFNIATFVVRAKAVVNSNEIISVGNIQFYDENYNAISIASVNKSIRIPSNDNNLSTLTVENGNLSFSPGILNYQLTINQPSTVISATKADGNASISGDIGNKNLNYGVNTFHITVTSEVGSAKTYTISITRPDNRSRENSLKSLSLSKGKINFQSNVLNYNVTVESNVDNISINAALKDSKSSFVSGLGPRTVNLNYGNNVVVISIMAENQTTKNYTLNIYRKPVEQPKPSENHTDNKTNDGQQTKSNDNYLKVLYLSSGVLDFKQDILDYHVIVPYTVKELEIKAEASNDKAKIEGLGKHTLQIGENKFEIKVTAENGDVKTYTIKITRKEETNEKLDSNNKLKSLTIKDHKIDFDGNKHNYEVVLGTLKELDITALAESDKATVTIIGNENLKVGNEIKIIVTSEDGNNNIYRIKLTIDNKTWMPIGVGIFSLGLLVVVIAIMYRYKKQKGSLK